MSIVDEISKSSWNKKIIILRTIMGLSQQELADKIGTTRKVLYLWETGRTNPRKVSRKAICRALRSTELEIFGAAI